jgi:hypothetical protein
MTTEAKAQGPISIRLPEEIVVAVDVLAKLGHRSRNGQLVYMLSDWLLQMGPEVRGVQELTPVLVAPVELRVPEQKAAGGGEDSHDVKTCKIYRCFACQAAGKKF